MSKVDGCKMAAVRKLCLWSNLSCYRGSESQCMSVQAVARGWPSKMVCGFNSRRAFLLLVPLCTLKLYCVHSTELVKKETNPTECGRSYVGAYEVSDSGMNHSSLPSSSSPRSAWLVINQSML